MENELLVKIIHPHILHKTLENSANASKAKSLDDTPKKIRDSVDDDDNDSGDSYEDEDDLQWLCEGTEKFKGGCKSGQ